MVSRYLAQGILVLALGACSAEFDPISGATAGAAGNVPEAVLLSAAPYQDATTARVRPEDGCYWYLHQGPVETTLLPLRTAEGRAICTGSGPAVSG